MLKEFKDFINKGDVVTVAVGLVMALYFKTIIDKVIEGVITPIIAAIAGEGSYTNIARRQHASRRAGPAPGCRPG